MFASIWSVHGFSQPDLLTDSTNLTYPESGVFQKHKIDSLKAILQNQPDDRKKVMLLNEFAGLLTHISYDSVMVYSDLALSIARKIKDWQGAFNAIKNKGFVVQVIKNDWTGAIRHYKEAIRLAEEYNIYDALHEGYSIIINCYFYLGDFPAAMETAVMGLSSARERNDHPKIFEYNSLVGTVFFRQQNFDESIKYYQHANTIANELNDDEMRGIIYNRFADVFIARKDSQQAFAYLSKAQLIFEKLYQQKNYGKKHLYPNTLFRIGYAHKSFGDLNNALDFTVAALKYAGEVSTDKFDLANYYLQAGDIYRQLKQFDSSRIHLDKGLSIARSIHHKEDLRDGYKFLADNYADQGMYDSAYIYSELHKQLKDSIVNEISRYRTEEIKAIYDIQEKNKVIVRQENMRNILISAFIVMLITMAFLYNRYRLRQKNRYQKELNRSQNELFNAVALAQDNERKRIAQDIHDSLGAMLSAAKMKLSGLRNDADESGTVGAGKLSDTLQLIDEASSELRSIAQNIMPASLAKLGLIAALRNLVASISSNSNVRVEFSAHEITERLDEQTEMSIYRIVLELINNAIKHATATKIIIQLVGHPKYINISVEDNGIGFDHKQAVADKKGIGLANIASRVKYLNGTMHIDSEGGRGTSVIIDIPLGGSLN